MIDRVLLPLFRTLAAVLLTVLFAASVVVFGTDRYVFRDTVYHRISQDEAFVTGMKSYVEDMLQDECLFYDLPFDTVKQAVTDDWVASLCEQYTTAMYTALNTGETVSEFTVDPMPYRVVLDTFFASLPEGQRPMDPNTSATIAGELAVGTAHILQGGVSDKLIDYGHRFVYGNSTMQRVRHSQVWLWILTALSAVCCILPIRRSWRQRLYATAGSLFVGSALVFVPFQLLHWHNIPSRWVLGDSPLKLYADSLWNGVIGGMTNVALIVFIVCALLLVASIVTTVWPHKNTN